MFKNINKNPTKSVNKMHFLVLMCSFIMLSACIKNTDLVGYTFKNENLDQIKLGSTSAYVQNTLGSPSVTSAYGDKVWYYISTEYESVAFFEPKIKNQKIVEIAFDDAEKITEIKQYSAKDARDIKISRDKTSAGGADIGIMQQLLGNVGRFNSEPGQTKITKPKNTSR